MKNSSLEFIKIYEQEMEKFCLPSQFRGHYRITQCLKEKEASWTVIAVDTVTEEPFIIKWGRDSQEEVLRREFSILQELRERKIEGVPRPYTLVKEGEGVYLLRQYAQGMSLYEISQDTESFPRETILNVGTALCEIVEKLHSLDNPVIHKDIKPENVVMDQSGAIVIPDFGTARHYREGQEGDTLLLGSPHTAAPEQYGYTQTDRRTDIYAIGRTLWFLAAGCYEEEGLKAAPIGRRLKKIIRKAAFFDPDKRYQTVYELKRALQSVRTSRRRRNAVAVTFAVLALCALGSTWYLGSRYQGTLYKNPKEDEVQNQSVVFAEEIIEQAVREQLWLTDGEPITEEMLENITSLRIVGTKILEEGDELAVRFKLYVNSKKMDGESGNIQELTDLSKMKNLEVLSLCSQRIVDLTPLEGLPLRSLQLTENRIQSVDVLKKLPLLEELYIGGNPLVNLKSLGECRLIKKLNIDTMKVQNLEFLETMDLTDLSILGTTLNHGDFSPILTQKNLDTLCVSSLKEEETEILCQLHWLSHFNAWGFYELQSLEPLGGMDSLKTMAMSGGLYSLEGIGNFKELTDIYLDGSSITDITPVKDAPQLKWLDIRRLEIEDLQPLFQHPGLEKVQCSQNLKNKILEENPSPRFEIIT